MSATSPQAAFDGLSRPDRGDAPSLLDRSMPTWSLREVDRVAVAASPAQAFATVRELDPSVCASCAGYSSSGHCPIAFGRAGEDALGILTSRIDDITRSGSGFQLLGERRGTEVVVGAIGKFWQPSIEFQRVTPAEFPSFDRPGQGKVAWCLRVDPRAGGGAWISVDVRVGATDLTSWAQFQRYWSLIGPFSRLIRRRLLRSLARELVPPLPEDTRVLLGDELLPSAQVTKTQAVTIEVPPGRLWPWLLQMGCRRAGWYSLDWLDNGGVRSAERIVPESPARSWATSLPATPTIGVASRCPAGAAIRPVVVASTATVRRAADQAEQVFAQKLTAFPPPVRDIGETFFSATVDPSPSAPGRRYRGVLAPGERLKSVEIRVAATVMEHAQLRNLKRRAEAMAR
jgi:hypothetical protein